MSQGQRKLAAIMFTDMVGYTALGQKNESLSIALVEEQRKLIRPILRKHDGGEVKTIGDAFLVEFPTAVDAVRCAYDIQRTIREFNLSLASDKRIHLRIGLHVGEVVESQGDISGDAVNVASRIESLAEDGGVCITRQVYDHVQNKVDLPLLSIGPRSLKNVTEPVEVYKMLMPWEKEVVASPAALDARRIAVLPFANMSPDPADEYFADGMTEEIISTASSITGLTLIARTSVMSYKGSAKKVAEIGRELNVGSVLEGSVRKAGNKLRITVQLIDAQSEGHLWAKSYDKDFGDVFAIQSDIAEKVADALRVRMLPVERHKVEKMPTRNTEAYTLYLKGRYFWNERTEDSTKKALKYFQEATKADPEFAMAYSGISDSYNVLSDWEWLPQSEAGPLAEANAAKAIAIDESLAEAHASLGSSHYHSWNFPSAQRELKRAIDLKPNYAPAHHWYGQLFLFSRRFDEAAVEENLALELDPHFALYRFVVANVQFATDLRANDALKRYEELLEMYPDFGVIHRWKSSTHVFLSQFDMALDEAKKFVEAEDGSWKSKLQLAWVYAAAKNREAERLLGEAIAARDRAFISPCDIGRILLMAGKTDEGFSWLQRAYEEHDPNLLFFNFVPWTKEFRSDPRWVEVERKIGFL